MVKDHPSHVSLQHYQKIICGVDEAGRGALAGPVFAAAVILNPHHPVLGIRDSKKLSAMQRRRIAQNIKKYAITWAIAQASIEEIENYNILHASLLAMQRAVLALFPRPTAVLIDGQHSPQLPYPTQNIIRGDQSIPAIAAASILAKTARDALLQSLHHQYPAYHFDQHKGYPTALHREKLQEYGPCAIHRRAFAPVRAFLR